MSPGVCNGGGVTEFTMNDTKLWNCVYAVLQVIAACCFLECNTIESATHFRCVNESLVYVAGSSLEGTGWYFGEEYLC